MPAPDKFSWVEKPHLAAMAKPSDREELTWLRAQGIELIISLTESPLRRDWVNDAGLMAVHVPVPDLTAPTPDQLEHCLSVIRRAQDKKFGVAIHCAAGLGRTGTLLAVWYVAQGLDPATAIVKVRELRPGSIETPEQERAVYQFVNKEPPPRATKDESDDDSEVRVKIERKTKNESLPSAGQFNLAIEKVRGLSITESDPKIYFPKFLKQVVKGIDAHAGAVWLRTKTGFLHLETQENVNEVGLDKHKNGRQSHNELLRQAFQMGRPMLLEPYGTSGILEGLPAGNPTEYFCLFAPIQMNATVQKQAGIWGLLELWTEPKFDVQMQRTFLNYLAQMAGYVAQFLRQTNYPNE